MYKKIDIYIKNKPSKYFVYTYSTNQSKTCKEAKKRVCEKYSIRPENVKCKFWR